jgi:hypothetical protein
MALMTENELQVAKSSLAKEIRQRIAKILDELENQSVLGHDGPGLRCPKCGCSMVHYRLYGYRCIRMCQ